MHLTLSQDDLRPIVAAVVDEVRARQDDAEGRLPATRLAYTEAEAAALMGVARHVLRDCRLRGEIKAQRVGSRWLYERGVLVKWLQGGSDR